jgi:YcxB-like protein
VLAVFASYRFHREQTYRRPMDTASMVLSFQPEREELARAIARHSGANKTARICMLLGAISIALGVYSLVTINTRVNDAIAGFGVVFGLILLSSNSAAGRRRQLRAVIERTPTLSDHREVVASPDGLRVVTPTSDSRLAWSHYQSVVDDDLGVNLILRGGSTVHFVPRRAFSDASEQTSWAQRVNSWINEASAPAEA